MGNYYCLISGLPELQLDDQKLKLSLFEFKSELEENLSVADLQLLNYFFMQYDNENIVRLLNDKNFDFDINLGCYSREELIDVIELFKESDTPNNPLIFGYLKEFIPAFMRKEEIFQGMTWADQLTSLYYDYAVKCKNEFISSWFEYNLNITNILTAVNCRKYGFDKDISVLGANEVAESIRNSNTRDFDISPLFPEVDEILRIAEETDIFERERKIDLVKWRWLDDNGFFHYFDVEHLFIYLIKMDMLRRWVVLEKDSGKHVFREMISILKQSFEFPNEFTIRQVK